MDQGTHFRSRPKVGIDQVKNGFKLWQEGTKDNPEQEGSIRYFRE